MESLAKKLAEYINGGTWEDPRYYTEEQKDLWREHAGVVKEMFRDAGD